MSSPKNLRQLRQREFISLPPTWTNEWQDMPDYTHRDLQPWRTILLHFSNDADVQDFCEKIGQKVTPTTKFLWHPKAKIDHVTSKRVVATFPRNPQYPVYIVSKGRWESRLTSKALEEIGVPYHIVVEPQEYKDYASVIDKKKILKLPFSNLGQGSIPARNWIWDHAVKSGAARHWILDDNIRGFYRYQDNRKVPVGDGTVFAVAENFVDRYENVAIAGFQYNMFVVRKEGRIPPFFLNTRVYSCILIKNDLKVRVNQTPVLAETPDRGKMETLRWRGRYNEDTDLSLRVLKDGHCTILFNSFLANKIATMRMKGGNTEELYQEGGEEDKGGRLKMAESLLEQHPDCVKVITRWGRAQHHINYKLFHRAKLIRKAKPKTLSKKELELEIRPASKK